MRIESSRCLTYVNVSVDTSQEVILSVLPFFHIYGFNGILNASIMHGMHIITLPKFTPEDYLACVAKYRVSASLVKIYIYNRNIGIKGAILPVN